VKKREVFLQLLHCAPDRAAARMTPCPGNYGESPAVFAGSVAMLEMSSSHGCGSSFDRSVAVTGDNLYGIVARRRATSEVSNVAATAFFDTSSLAGG
jgi:hypothetical protein